MTSYLIRPARDGDVDRMLHLRRERAEWLASRDIVQWTDEHADYAEGAMREFAASGAAWVVEDDALVVATVSLNGPDLDLWSNDLSPDDALYLGKMVTARSHAGQGIGAAMMNWAGRKAERAGKRWLRLDCRRDNVGLHDYYKGHGFGHLRTVVPDPARRIAMGVAPTQSGALFQRPATMTTATPAELWEQTWTPEFPGLM